MLAYKFLGAGRYSLLAGFSWPLGSWVGVDGRLVPTVNGVHACRVGDLPHWLDEALWRIELDGDVLESARALVATRGRLVERVASWNPHTATEFVAACSARSRGLGTADPDAGWVPSAGAAYIAAHGAGVEALLAGESYEPAFVAERSWQAAWLRERLALD